MEIDIDILADAQNDQIDLLPTEATFRNGVINIRCGEAPQTRTFILAGIEKAQSFEALIKRDDVGDTAPAGGELITIRDARYKIGTVIPLVSPANPAGYRVTLSRVL